MPSIYEWQDVRTPADTQDQQTTDAQTAKPPAEMVVSRGVNSNTISITDYQSPAGRGPTISYRIYFLPEAFTTFYSPVIGTSLPPNVSYSALRESGKRVATLVTTVGAPGFGGVIVYQDTGNFQKKGYYFCTGVNRSSIEGIATNMVKAP